jgi:hypothetical protein
MTLRGLVERWACAPLDPDELRRKSSTSAIDAWVAAYVRADAQPPEDDGHG